MNCESIRSRILAKTHPEKLPAVYREHVQACPACQAWHQQVLAMEHAVTAVVVPASTRKEAFLQQFRTATVALPEPTVSTEVKSQPSVAKPKSTPKAKSATVAKTAKAPVAPATPARPWSDRLAKAWPAGVAAVIVLGGAVLWSLKSGDNGTTQVAAATRDPLTEKAVLLNVKLDTTANAAEKMKVLANFADDLHDEAKTLAKLAPGPEMESLAKMFDRIVRDAMIFQARSLDVAQNKQLLLECVERLGKVEQDANRLSVEAPQGSEQALREIAAAAKEGKEKIAQLTFGKGKLS